MVPSFVYLLFKFYFKSGRLCYLRFDTKYLSFQTISLVTRTLIRLFFLYFSSDKLYNSKGGYVLRSFLGLQTFSFKQISPLESGQ